MGQLPIQGNESIEARTKRIHSIDPGSTFYQMISETRGKERITIRSRSPQHITCTLTAFFTGQPPRVPHKFVGITRGEVIPIPEVCKILFLKKHQRRQLDIDVLDRHLPFEEELFTELVRFRGKAGSHSQVE